MMVKTSRPRKVTTVRSIHRQPGGGIRYEEKRGLRSIRLDSAAGPEDVKARAKKLLYVARRILQKAGVKPLADVVQEAEQGKQNSASAALNTALAHWTGELMVSHGMLSPVTLAAQVLAHATSISSQLVELMVPEDGLEDAAAEKALEEHAAIMKQIYHLADAWHWFHMEVSGEHELAFAKTEHVSRQARGSQTTASKGARRAEIIRTAIKVARETGRVDMSKVSKVAKAIKSVVDAECIKNVPPLPVSVGAAAFERLVGNIMKTDRKG